MDLTTLERLPMWIGGRAHAPTTTRYGEVTNPATGEVVRHVPFANAADVDAAVRSAEAAFGTWRAAPPLRRARVMMRFRELMDAHKKDLAKIVTQEHGKTLADAGGLDHARHRGRRVRDGHPAPSQGRAQRERRHRRRHVVDPPAARRVRGHHAVQLPGDGPDVDVPDRDRLRQHVHPEAFRARPDAVVAHGRAAQGSRFARRRVQRRARRQGGRRRAARASIDPRRVVRRLDADRAYIYETGTRHGKRVQALGGAKNHAVVLPDADLDYATEAIIGAGYGSAGERCMAISAVVAVGEAGDPLVAKLAARAKRITTGPGNAPGIEMGPVITCAARDRITGLIDKGVEEGATLVLDGRKPSIDGHPDGFFVGPTLFDHVKPSHAIYREEIFGPVLAVVRADSLDEAIGLINTNPYANGAAVFTRSGHAARVFQQDCEVGWPGVNVPIPVPMAFFSFGGWRNSLFGDLHVHGMDGVRFYTRTKVMTSRWPDDGSAAPGFHMPVMG
jgi:malonate-semialdehyde dehydrogenase (acetylating)/methylmalonate-semialdehyde dehydrogenase